MTDQLNDTRTQIEHQIHMRKRRSIKVFVARFERPKTNLIRILRWHIGIATSLKPDYWESFADGIGDDGSEEEVRGKQVDEAEHQHLQHRSHVTIQMFSCEVFSSVLSLDIIIQKHWIQVGSPQIWWGRTHGHRGALRQKSARCPGDGVDWYHGRMMSHVRRYKWCNQGDIDHLVKDGLVPCHHVLEFYVQNCLQDHLLSNLGRVKYC